MMQTDAAAICEAVTRPSMRFVAHKTVEQQDIQTLHRIRQRTIHNQTQLVNQIRGILREYGVILPEGVSHVKKQLPLILENADNELTPVTRELLSDLYHELADKQALVKRYEQRIKQISKTSEHCQRLQTIPGIDPLTASALLAAIGNAKHFKNSRQLSAWLGLVPKQYSSGGKTRLSRITKRGDKYLRTLLVQGARAVIKYAVNKTDSVSLWIQSLIQRCGYFKTVIAVANKNARICWSLLTKEEVYQADFNSYPTYC